MNDFYTLEYQVMTKDKSNLEQKIKSSYDELEIEEPPYFIYGIFNISNDRQISNIALSINKNDIQHIKSFEDILKTISICTAKLKDEFQEERIKKVYAELFEIETNLRDVFFLILTDSFPQNEWHSLFEPFYTFFHTLKNLKDRKKKFTENMINELFYLGLEDYEKLATKPSFKIEKLLDDIRNSEDFESFSRNILCKGITRADYITFISNIKNSLLIICNIRNDIAHFRFINDKTFASFEQAKIDLESNIRNFYKECWG